MLFLLYEEIRLEKVEYHFRVDDDVPFVVLGANAFVVFVFEEIVYFVVVLGGAGELDRSMATC